MAISETTPSRKGALLGMSGQLKSIVKHRTLGLRKGGAVQKTGGQIFLYIVRRVCFCTRSCLLRVTHDDLTCIKNFTGINLTVLISSTALWSIVYFPNFMKSTRNFSSCCSQSNKQWSKHYPHQPVGGEKCILKSLSPPLDGLKVMFLQAYRRPS